MADETMFDVARRQVKIADLAAGFTVLTGNGREMRGACPLCKGAKKPAKASDAGAAKRKKKKGGGGAAPFVIYPDQGRFWTFCCEEGGDVVDLYRHVKGGSVIDAVRALAGTEPLPRSPDRPIEREKPKAEGPSGSQVIAAEMWRAGRAFAGSLGETYLLGRDIVPEVVSAASANLRFHPRAKWAWDADGRRWLYAPAMLMLVVVAGADGAARATGGVHATYLTAEGDKVAWSDDENLAPKKMWGPQGLDGAPGGTWLIGPAGEGPVATAEGSENALAMASMEFRRSGRIIRTCAALSLGRLQGGMLKDADKRIDPYDVQPDPKRPAFVWPGLGEVWIGIDRDMKTVWPKCRTPRGKTCRFGLDAEARARICAKLASAAWAAAGAKPTPIWASIGSDLNDDLRRVIAAGKRPA